MAMAKAITALSIVAFSLAGCGKMDTATSGDLLGQKETGTAQGLGYPQNQKTELVDKRYVNPKGYYQVVPPVGWRIKEHPDDVHSKVTFLSPDGDETLMVTIVAVDLDTIDEMLTLSHLTAKRLEKRLGVAMEIAEFDFYGREAVRKSYEIAGSRFLDVTFPIGKVCHSLQYSAPLDKYDQCLPVVLKSMETYEPIRKEESDEDGSDYLAVKKFRIGRMMFEAGRFDRAAEYVHEGLAVAPENRDLLELKQKIESQFKNPDVALPKSEFANETLNRTSEEESVQSLRSVTVTEHSVNALESSSNGVTIGEDTVGLPREHDQNSDRTPSPMSIGTSAFLPKERLIHEFMKHSVDTKAVLSYHAEATTWSLSINAPDDKLVCSRSVEGIGNPTGSILTAAPGGGIDPTITRPMLVKNLIIRVYQRGSTYRRQDVSQPGSITTMAKRSPSPDQKPIQLSSFEDLVPFIGVGSEIRFSGDDWVELGGKKYRNGGFRITKTEFIFLPGTEFEGPDGNVVSLDSQFKKTDKQELVVGEEPFEPLFIESACSMVADVTNRNAASSFKLSYENPRKYFGAKLDPISVKDNSPDQPWWILHTKGKIHWHGHNQATKAGILIGGNWMDNVTETGHKFSAIPGGEMQLALAHEQDLARALGVGSEVKLDSVNWVPICGKQYRMGGFRISSNRLEFLPGTEGRQGNDGKVFIFDGTDWKPVKP